jgi:hypothetical protein
MTPGNRHDGGNAILETLVLLPVVSLLLVGIIASGNQLSMLSAAESAAHAEALRSARAQTSQAPAWNRFFPDNEERFRFDSSSGSGSRILPSPFPALAGRASVSVILDRKWDPLTRSGIGLDRQRVMRSDTVSGDCWAGSSGSGKKIKSTVKLLVGTGVL